MLLKSLSALPLFALLAVSAHAQTQPATQPRTHGGAPTAATELTRAMSTRLQLNEGQYVQLLRINRARQLQQQTIEQATIGNESARATRLAELQAQYEQECGRVLSPSQLAQLTQPAAVGGKG